MSYAFALRCGVEAVPADAERAALSDVNCSSIWWKRARLLANSLLDHISVSECMGTCYVCNLTIKVNRANQRGPRMA